MLQAQHESLYISRPADFATSRELVDAPELNLSQTVVAELHTQHEFGGQVSVVRDEAQMLADMGAQVQAFTVREMQPHEWGNFPTTQIQYIPGREGYFPKEDQYDHYNYAAGEVMPYLMDQIRQTNARHVILRGHHSDGALVAYTLGRMLREQGINPLVTATVHSLAEEKFDGTRIFDVLDYRINNGGNKRREVEAKLYTQIALEGLLTTASPLQLKYFREFGIDDEDVLILPPGINQGVFTDQGNEDDDWAILEQMGVNRGERFIYSPGRMSDQKGHHRTIAAFAEVAHRHSDIKIVFTGGKDTPKDQEYRALLWRTAQQAGIADRIIMNHALPQPEVAAIARRSTMAVHAAGYDHFNLMVGEIMACGAPTVAGESMGATAAAHEYGRKRAANAVIPVDVFNRSQLAASIDLVLSDENIRSQLSINGKEWAQTLSLEDSMIRMLQASAIRVHKMEKRVAMGKFAD